MGAKILKHSSVIVFLKRMKVLWDCARDDGKHQQKLVAMMLR